MKKLVTVLAATAFTVVTMTSPAAQADQKEATNTIVVFDTTGDARATDGDATDNRVDITRVSYRYRFVADRGRALVINTNFKQSALGQMSVTWMTVNGRDYVVAHQRGLVRVHFMDKNGQSEHVTIPWRRTELSPVGEPGQMKVTLPASIFADPHARGTLLNVTEARTAILGNTTSDYAPATRTTLALYRVS